MCRENSLFLFLIIPNDKSGCLKVTASVCKNLASAEDDVYAYRTGKF